MRVHVDAEADHLARAVDAEAFTSGQGIFFRAGAYNPGSRAGLHRLAHEAAHAVQQAQGPVAGTPAPGGISVSHPSDSFEQAAEQAAQRVVSGSAGTEAVQRAATTPEEEPMRAIKAGTWSRSRLP